MRELAIIGGGISGVGAAVLAKKMGWDVFLSDGGSLKEEYKNLLLANDIAFEEGGHTLEKLVEADEAVKSPGVPDTAAVVMALRERGVNIISEIEFAGRYMGSARTICITGSNGKTTTTTLIYELLKDADFHVGLGGNIGKGFALGVAEEQYDWWVLELSSFQLDGMKDFRADIGVLTNITPDHLDRYDHSLAKYAASKMQITRNQTASDTFIYNSEDPVTKEQMQGRTFNMQLKPFPRTGILPSVTLKIKGRHNECNAQAAVLAARAAGVPEESIRKTLANFAGIEHRMEHVCERDGVEWINDSKATNVDAVWYALDSMTRPTVWIAGGTDKGNDYEPLKELARRHVHTLVCMGVDNAKLLREFEGVVPVIVDTHSLADAMDACRASARPGDTVLLSPACASFDLFKNYEDRGEQFKESIVKE